MENNQQKWVSLSFVVGSALVAIVIYMLASKFSVMLDFEGRFRSLDKVILFGSVVIGIGLYLGLSKNAKSSGFMNEVVAEVVKVTWPEQEETVKATIAVLISVVIAGVALWIVDGVWAAILGYIV